MILKNWLLVLLAVFLILGCVGVVSADDTLITSVEISEITTPIAGSAPFTGTPTFTTDPPNNATSNSVSWFTNDNTPFSGNFAYSTVYIAKFTLTAVTDSNFSVTGFTYTGEGTEVITVSSDKKTADIVITFEETGPEPVASTNVSSVSVTGIPAPVAGGTPVTTASLISDPTGKAVLTAVSWAYSNGTEFTGTFGYGTIYKANITLSTTDSYTFNSSTTYTVENATVDSHVLSSENTISVLTCTYSATAAQPPTPISSVIIAGVTAPVYGADPVTSATSSTTGISSVTVSWSPTVSSTFAADTTYNATIVVRTTSPSYVFSTSTPSVSLNGATASTANVTRDSDTRITITYTFPKTAAKVLPTAVLSSNVTSGTVPLTIKFYYTLSSFDNCTLTYRDGYSSTLTSSSGNVTHTDTTAGNYTAFLTAKNINGTTYSNQSITVKKVGLDASFTESSSSGTAPLTVLFVDTSVGSPTQWVWDFGGLGSSALQNPSYTFTTAGTYIVKLTIIDSTGATDSYSRAIYVNAPAATSTPTATQTTALTTTSFTAISIGEVSVPAPLDIIKEFMHLFYSLFDSTNYLFIVNES